MRRLGEEKNGVSVAAWTSDEGMLTAQSYGKTPNNPLTWDYDSMQGCLCDEGWTGYDCSLRLCKTGPDPMGRHAITSLFEIQDVNCVGTSGEFSLTFRGGDSSTRDYSSREGRYTTDWLPFDATEAQVKAAMEELTGVGRVNVKFTRKHNTTDSDHDRACTATYAEETNHVQIQFLDQLGNLPTMKHSLRPDSSGQGILYMIVNADGNAMSVKGTKTNFECSNRGICDRLLGTCRCFTGYTSSNGELKPGDRGDCGAVLEYVGILE
jgi:hypothetical protein